MTNSFWVFPTNLWWCWCWFWLRQKKNQKNVQFRKELQGLLLVRLQHRVLRKCLVICFHPGTEKKDWPAEGKTISLIWQPANCAKATLVSAWPMSVWALTLAQENQLLTRCSHSQLYLPSPLLVKLFIPEICMYYMYMYVQNLTYRTWTYQPEKMSHTSLCVRVIHHSARRVQWDKPGSSLAIW